MRRISINTRLIKGESLKASSSTLEHNTLSLLDLVQVNVSDHQGPENAKTHQTSSSSKHSCLRITIGGLNCQSGRRSDGVAELGWKVFVDQIDVVHGRIREPGLQSFVEGVGPDGTTDSGTSGIT